MENSYNTVDKGLPRSGYHPSHKDSGSYYDLLYDARDAAVEFLLGIIKTLIIIPAIILDDCWKLCHRF